MQCGSLYCWMDANAGQWINYVTTFNGMIEVLSPPSYRECDPSKTLCAKGSGNTVFMKGTLPATPFTVAVFGRNGTLIFAWRFGGPKPDLDREIDSTSSPTGTTFVLVNHETTPNYPKGQMQCGSLYCWMDANAGQWIDYVMIYNGMVEILSPPYYLECDKTKTVCTKSKGNTVYMNGTLPATPFTVAVFGRNGTLIFAWRFGGPKPDLDREIDSTPSPTGTTHDYGNQETTLDNQK
ncbi:unnamed protein product [Hymenolepis diminuta]|uniref:DUF5727 domain-containing protein n=1 Tax=Hymenolepis diminuta TaxID=6216 RepID=A0A0R3SMX4_HYMDI|nr:unnamed protein product [Hymenolepis diminuta]